MSPFLQYYFDPKGHPWWQGNVYGNLVASILLSGGIILTWYKVHFKCAACWRPSHHPVSNTHLKSCHKHANATEHGKIEAAFAKKHPEAHKFLKEKN